MKYILFDTSTWITQINEKSNLQIMTLAEKGITPFITIDVLFELLNVSPEKRKARLEYLLEIPKLATIRYDNPILGSVIDLRCYEYKYFLEEKSKNKIEYLQDKIVYFSGKELSYYINFNFDQIIDEQRLMNICLSQSMYNLYENKKIKKMKLKNLKFRHSLSDEEYIDFKKNVIALFVDGGDKKRPLVERELAGSLLVKLLDEMHIMDKKGIDTFPKISSLLGLNPNEDNEQSLEESMMLFEYKSKLHVFANTLKIDIKNLLNIDERNITSWIIEKKFKIEYENILLSDNNRIPESSSITDKRLSCFSFLFPVIVDKRTRDILDKVKNKIDTVITYYFVSDINSLDQLIQSLV
jgi:hypothetical protein